MSDCNYCSLQRIKRDARKDGLTVTVLRDAAWGMGGQNVYVHPKGVKIAKLPGGEDGERAKYRQSWFMELPDGCRC